MNEPLDCNHIIQLVNDTVPVDFHIGRQANPIEFLSQMTSDIENL